MQIQEGFTAYHDQRFHSIAASLMGAKEIRKLALIAVIVSISTLLVTVISLLCTYFNANTTIE